MKQIIAILILILSVSKTTVAQEYIYQHGLVTLQMGVALPAYDLGSLSGLTLTSYAKIGTNIKVEADYFYSFHAGVGFIVNYSVNPVNTDKLSQGYLKSSEAFKTVTAESESFRDFSGLVGMVFDIPVNKYFSVMLKMFGGLRNVYKPAALIKTTTEFSSVDYYETSTNETIFAIMASAGARVIVNDHINLHLSFSYIGSTVPFVYKRNSKEINQDAHVGALSVDVGISYSF